MAKSPRVRWDAFSRSFVPFEKEREAVAIADYPDWLRGAGVNQLGRQRGFKGSTFGAASVGRRLPRAERDAVAAKLRAEGKL